ncbi:uncharacterized protein C8R40DRAFT_1178928 [Lentinula edodes]|uniref:uncharacterized protein n=1 Tax=Lentinula edodes TaxID=5353 RepID=UPI001E8CCC14|nr:uncharacterized protein C8R40DRAFT_1178928 [Lentinula edodes]KAH7867626.1 hypothetical protein C8R40DRAFT_1178928 [Lentinula edodes]
MYAYAMFINPTAKLKWIEKHWGLSEIVQAKAAIHNVMLQHQQELCKQQNDLVTPTRASLDIGGSDAAYSQCSGLDALDEYSASISILSRSSSLSSLPLTSNEESDTTSDGPQALTEDEIDGANEEAVEREFTRWLSEGIITDCEKLKSFDLIRFWDNESIQKAYPILFRLALDVLPVC